MTIDLEGEHFFVRFSIFQRSRTRSSRGDHGMGGGEYTIYYWTGTVTVTASNESKVLAVCQCLHQAGYDYERDGRNLIIPTYLLPEREKQFADLMGQEIISIFSAHRDRGTPSFQLQPLSKDVLIEAGLAVGSDEQLNVPLGV